MKFLCFGLDTSTAKRIWILWAIGLFGIVYLPMIYAMTIFYAYFRVWDITSTTDLRLKIQKASAELFGLGLGSVIAMIIIGPVSDPAAIQFFAKFIIKICIVYETAVLLFVYVHHFGFHSKSENLPIKES